MRLILIALFCFIGHCYGQNHPWVGQPKNETWWMDRHEAFLNMTSEHKNDIKIVFFGDSITEGWAGSGKEIWAKYYTPRHAYNYGIGGDRTEHLIWRIENKEFDGVSAKVVVLKIGTNNLGSNTEEDIAHGIKTITEKLLAKMPATKILLLGIIPRAGEDLEKKVQTINTLISKYNDNKQIFYLDMSSKFQDSPGKEKVGLYSDTVHLTKEGYQVWYETMEPLLKKLESGSAAENHPWIGQPRDAAWIKHHESLVNQTIAHKDDIKIVFFGDSITAGWAGNGKEIWAKYYTPRHAYNYGIGGDRTEHLIWRIENKEFDGVMAKVVVLKIGTNNLGANTAEDIAHGIKEIINQLFVKMPSTKVLLLGIIPRNGTIETKVQEINTIISKYNDDKKVFYLDMSSKFQDSPGKEKAGLYSDTVHLTKDGYQVWYDTMEPLLNKLYSE